jgi:hypothetical protein
MPIQKEALQSVRNVHTVLYRPRMVGIERVCHAMQCNGHILR